MEFTGERVIPGKTDPDLMNEHLARYCFAEALVGQKKVLDAGCGLAYGAARLARRASRVVALDNSLEPLRGGRAEFSAPNVRFVQGDCACLPFPSAAFDVVVAFEVIEHLETWRSFLEEASRVLLPSGHFIVSTPNREYYAETRLEPNPYHCHEFDYQEFRAELEKVFRHVIIFLENHSNAISFTPLKIEGVRTTLEGNATKPEESHFFLATCSKRPLFGSPAFVYLPQSGNVLRDREHHIDLLEGEVKQKEKWLEEVTAELKELDQQYQTEQKLAKKTIGELELENAQKTKWAEELEQNYQKELDSRTEWINNLKAELAEAHERLKTERAEAVEKLEKCIKLLDEAEQRVIERSEWAQRLDRELAEAREQLAKIYASPAYRFGRRLGLAPDPSVENSQTPSDAKPQADK